MKARSKDKEISVEYLRSILDYDPETGVLTWKPRDPRLETFTSEQSLRVFMLWNRQFANKPAGTVTENGAIRIKVLGGLRMAHNIAWAIHYGEWPKKTIQHKNRNRSDNRIRNFQDADLTELAEQLSREFFSSEQISNTNQ